MDPAPLVSIIVLNFNGEHIIARCLDHLLAQTYQPIEILVVDNASTDRSREILEGYAGKIRLLASDRNHGCAGGRNVGLAAANGAIVAFMDNDGYAAPTWLAEAVRLLHDVRVGAVAPLVFFNRHKLVLNGAGGTLNRRGYGGDFCFREPYEFARLPRHVLYPMGCGMVVRRAVLDAMQGFDEQLFNYYDDVEVGVWSWRTGFEVLCAPAAWVDHDFGGSDVINRNKVLLCERNRIRTVLKYFPAGALPRWLFTELLSFFHLRPAWMWTIPYRAWGWNLANLGTALGIRRRFRARPCNLDPLIFPTWGEFPPPRPNSHLNRPEPARAGTELSFDGRDESQLNFGWYPLERDAQAELRWTTAAASCFVRVPSGAAHLEITWRAAAADQRTALRLRRLGELAPAWETLDAPATEWHTRRYACAPEAGAYELQLLTTPPVADRGGRELGVAVTRLAIA